ncbi:DUF3231 family protein [Niallia taxi]|uniref:DUF3231 family protein n=1 Tax=Niallia taxi TaxID=2499688 RepID=UPI003D265545
MPEQKIELTSTEIASLWTSYMNNTMSKCVLSHMKQYITDKEIADIVESANSISIEEVNKLQHIFHEENFAQPYGFTDKDVYLDAPALFTDTFSLLYINHMAKAGMLAYSGFTAMSYREDIIEHFILSLQLTVKLYKQSNDVLRKKGLLVRSPYILPPSNIDYIDSNSYLSGLNFFHKKRPLNAIEISHLFMNIQTNNIGYKISLAFGQTSDNKDVQEYMVRGKDISKKHVKIFADTLIDGNIQSPMSSDIGITQSTIRTFSDKLMMFHMSLLSASGIGNYATAAGASQRSDIAVNYERLSFEIAQYAKTGANIMIENSWLEQPPATADREKLIKEKQSE